jgi:membrane protease YdiL (CAAX protease family)
VFAFNPQVTSDLRVISSPGASNVFPMTDTEPGTPTPGVRLPPPQPPGPVPTGYVPREWVQQVPPPPTWTASTSERLEAPGLSSAETPPAPSPGGPFLDTPEVPPQTKRQGWMWLVFAVLGFLVGQFGALIFGEVAGLAAGKNAAQMRAITSAAVPPEWYVISTLLGLWVGFIGAPWLASRLQGTRRFLRDLGVRFRPIDLLGIAVGIGGQILVALMYLPFQHEIHDFNGPSQRLTGGSHGGGFIIIALATVLLAPAMEELFFRGLLFKALVRLFTPLGALRGGARTLGVVLAVVLDGLLFGLAHGEWVQLAGLAVFGMVLAAVSYRTGRLGMNMVAHATFNLVAIVAIASNGNALIH